MSDAQFLDQLVFVLETCAEALRGFADTRPPDRDALDAIADQIEGTADRLRLFAKRLAD